MPEDIARRPQRGDPLKIPASVYAEMLDVVQYVRILRNSESSSLVRLARDRGLVKIKNESGADCARFEVLGIDGIIDAINPTDNLPAWKNEPVLSGITPATPTHCGRFVVLVEPLADDAIGWACLSGVVPVQVDFTYDAAVYADVTNADDSKLTAGEGGMTVLYKGTGTGAKWALVKMGVPYWPILRGKLDANLNAGSSAAMSVWEGDTLADSTRNVTVYDHAGMLGTGKKIASTTVVTASWTSGKWYVLTSAACEVAQ